MQGTRVGLIQQPLPSDETCCPRCGLIFEHWQQSVVKGSPCADCRRTLRAEGDTTVWRRPGSSNKDRKTKTNE